MNLHSTCHNERKKLTIWFIRKNLVEEKIIGIIFTGTVADISPLTP